MTSPSLPYDVSHPNAELLRTPTFPRRSGGTLDRRDTHPVIASVAVSGVGRDDVAHPSEQATSADPQPRRDDKPQDASQDAAVVELPHSGDDRTQNCCQSRITHRYYSPPSTATLHSVSLWYVRLCAMFP